MMTTNEKLENDKRALKALSAEIGSIIEDATKHSNVRYLLIVAGDTEAGHTLTSTACNMSFAEAKCCVVPVAKSISKMADEKHEVH